MPLVPTFDMAAADPEDFGLDFDDLPDFMNQEGRPVGPGPSVEPGQDEAWRCVQCDSDHLLFDYLGRWRCGDCGCFRQYRTDRPTTRPAAHGQGQWHYVPAGDWPPGAAPNPQPSPGDPVVTSGRPAAARRRRRQRRHRGGPPSGDGASERSEQPESETLTFDPTVSVGDSSETSRRARRHDPHPRRPPGVPVQQADRRGDEPQRLPDPPLPRPELDHPSHLMTLDDVKDAATPGRKSKTSTATWNSRMGPEKNVRWRGGTPPAPPAWKYDVTDLRAFSKWARKIEIWRVQIGSYMTSREASLLLYTSLTGEAEAELEHAPLEKINHENGIDYILETLKAPMEQKAVYQKRKFLADFEQLNRYPGEGLWTFANRYRRVERSLEALGVNITGMYDAEARGNRLLERARLTLQDQRLILVGARYSLAFDDIADSMVLQYPEFKTAPPVVNKDGTLATRPPAAPRDRPGKGNSQPGQQAPGKGHYQNRDRHPFPPKKVFLSSPSRHPSWSTSTRRTPTRSRTFLTSPTADRTTRSTSPRAKTTMTATAPTLTRWLRC